MAFISGTSGGTAAGTATSGSAVINNAVAGYTCLIAVSSNVSLTGVTGFTLLTGFPTPNTASAGRLNVYYKILDGTELTTTITPSASARWSYVSATFSNPGIDTSAGSTAITAATTVTAPTATAASASSMLVSVYGCIGSTTTVQATYTATGVGQNEIADVSNSSTNRNPSVMMAYEALVSSGATGTRSANASTTVQQGCGTVILLPDTVGGSTGQVKVYNGSSFVAKPVKVWNGSAWVTKPLKRYNGSSWVITPY
jgi:hypothetical protein